MTAIVLSSLGCERGTSTPSCETPPPAAALAQALERSRAAIDVHVHLVDFAVELLATPEFERILREHPSKKNGRAP